MNKQPRFKIGTKFKTRGKHPKECIVRDIHTTVNSVGEVVKIRYVASHRLLGQDVYDYDVVDTTITRGLELPDEYGMYYETGEGWTFYRKDDLMPLRYNYFDNEIDTIISAWYDHLEG